jgi:hypothetical protein
MFGRYSAISRDPLRPGMGLPLQVTFAQQVARFEREPPSLGVNELIVGPGGSDAPSARPSPSGALGAHSALAGGRGR